MGSAGLQAGLSSVLLIATIGCSHDPTMRLPGSPPRVPRVETTAIEPMPWSPSRRLSWSDFLGIPQPASDASATTAYVISYDGECDGSRFSFHVATTFLPDRSWVKPTVLGSSVASRRVLQHEQTHFDLGELHARELRRALTELPDPCDGPADARNAVVERIMRLDDETQRRYDFETESGMEMSRQVEWENRVARQLTVLNKYTR
jgi:hypothetical protein